jgi:hypothetical protein
MFNAILRWCVYVQKMILKAIVIAFTLKAIDIPKYSTILTITQKYSNEKHFEHVYDFSNSSWFSNSSCY